MIARLWYQHTILRFLIQNKHSFILLAHSRNAMPKRKSTTVAEEALAAPSRRRSLRLSSGQSLQDDESATTTPVSVEPRSKKVATATPTPSKTAKADGVVKGKAKAQTEPQTKKRRSSVKSASKAVDESEVEALEPELATQEASDDEASEPPAKRSRTSRTQKQTRTSKEPAQEAKPSKKNQAKPNTPIPTTHGSKKQQKSQPAKARAKTTKSETDEAEQPAQTSNESENNSSTRNYWLLKAEPETRLENGKDVSFSIDDLASKTEPEPWDGIRNYVARNNLRAMKRGDLAFFYHSNCKEPGIVGTMEIVREHEPDLSAHDPKAPYYDPKSKPADPKWSVVHVEFRSKFAEPIGLKELRTMGDGPGKPLANMQLLKQSRLSVSKVSSEEWEYLVGVAESRGKVITKR